MGCTQSSSARAALEANAVRSPAVVIVINGSASIRHPGVRGRSSYEEGAECGPEIPNTSGRSMDMPSMREAAATIPVSQVLQSIATGGSALGRNDDVSSFIAAIQVEDLPSRNSSEQVVLVRTSSSSDLSVVDSDNAVAGAQADGEKNAEDVPSTIIIIHDPADSIQVDSLSSEVAEDSVPVDVSPSVSKQRGSITAERVPAHQQDQSSNGSGRAVWIADEESEVMENVGPSSSESTEEADSSRQEDRVVEAVSLSPPIDASQDDPVVEVIDIDDLESLDSVTAEVAADPPIPESNSRQPPQTDPSNPPRSIKLFSILSAGPNFDDISEDDLVVCDSRFIVLGQGSISRLRQALCLAASSVSFVEAREILKCVAPFLSNFDEKLRSHGIEVQIALCRELGLTAFGYAVYMFLDTDVLSTEGLSSYLEEMPIQRYGSVGDGLQRLDILTLENRPNSSRLQMKTKSLFTRHISSHEFWTTPGYEVLCT